MFIEEEGLRRPICDMALLLFHLVFSSFTYDGVDVGMAQKILDYHQKRYPNGPCPLSPRAQRTEMSFFWKACSSCLARAA